MSVTTQHEYTVDYEESAESPAGYKPKRKKFTTGVQLRFVPELKQNKNLIILTLNLKKTDLVKLKSKLHPSGNQVQLPVFQTAETRTTIAVQQGKYLLALLSGMSSRSNSSQPDKPVQQTILLVKADVQVGKEKDSDRQRVSQWIGADLPNSASNINFHETHFIDTSRMYVKFDFPVSDLEALLSESHRLPTFAQLTKDKKIMERVLEPDLDWWKLDELKDPLCGELRRGHYAPETLKPESIAVWIHSESQICCSEIEKGLMRVYIASLTDSSVVGNPVLGNQTEIKALKKVLYGMTKLIVKPCVALDLDNGEVIQLDKDWPDEYEVAWDNDGGGVLMSKPNGPATLWPIYDIKNWYDACDKVSKGNIKLENGNGHGVFANQSRFALVKTSQTNTAVVEIVDFDETKATIRWQIICQKSNDK